MRYNKNFGNAPDGVLTYAPNPLTINGADVFTNDAALYRSQGYKPIIRAPMPEPVEGYQWLSAWVESAEAVTLTWTQEAIPDTPTEQDYIDALADLGVNTDDESRT